MDIRHIRIAGARSAVLGLVVLAMSWVLGAISGMGGGTAFAADPVEIVSSSPRLNFGAFANGQNAGTLVVTPSNSRTASGGIEAGPGSYAPYHRAEFTVSGPANTPYTITLPATGSFTDSSGDPSGGFSIQVNNFTSFSTTVGAETTTGMTDINGADTIYVGGTLVVPGGTHVFGIYYGDVSITVDNL
jgi:uncharacterized protein DUF4402